MKHRSRSSTFEPDDDPEAKAAELGLDVYRPAPNEVLLDWDDPENDEHAYDKNLALLNEAMPNVDGAFLVETKRTTSKSGGTHVYLRCERDLSDLERTLLQAILGSDRTRETLGFIRIILGSTRPPGVLFEVRK